MSGFLTRFAPSPTGGLHLGSAFSALTVWDAAQAAGAPMLLRIEDIDHTRCRPEYEEQILEELAWLGLAWPEPVRRQSEHFADYARALDALIAAGLVYRCFKTRKEIAAEIARAPHGLTGDGPDGGVYAGPAEPMGADEAEARAGAGEPYAWRLSLAACRETLGARWDALSFIEENIDAPHAAQERPARPGRLGDFIVARKDLGASYHVASVADDALQGVTHVIRGEDLREAAHAHVLLQTLLGLPVPRYRHHRVILAEDGRRLSKRDKDCALSALRAGGASPNDIRARLGLARL